MFEKVEGGQLFNRIQERDLFTEREASQIIRDLANALKYLHSKGKKNGRANWLHAAIRALGYQQLTGVRSALQESLIVI